MVRERPNQTRPDDRTIRLGHELPELPRVTPMQVPGQFMRLAAADHERAVPLVPRERPAPHPKLHHVSVNAHPLRLGSRWHRLVGNRRPQLEPKRRHGVA